ncbi:MAG: hypothetical protein DRJ38_00225 [Thermoprotei archaeon]|nr:MAG: hypothetical protein DRJ38_00225 [Thermoprotei archaeon]
MSERAKTEQLLREWSQKTGRPFDELMGKLQQNIEQLKTVLPNATPDQLERKARFMVYRELKSLMRYPNLMTFDGVFIGIGPAMDVFARRREQALQMWQQDPGKAIQEGLCDVNGKPIFRMPSGQIIDISQPVMLRQTIAIARPASGGLTKLVVQIHRRDQVNNLPPLGKPVRWSANKRAETEFRYSTTAVAATKFTPIDVPDFKQSVIELLEATPDPLKVTCATIEQWHQQHQADAERICVLKGAVVFMRTEPTAVGNRLLVIEDETLLDLEAEGVTVWIHQDIAHMIDFGVGSEVYVVGRTVQMPGWNRETRQIDPNVTRIGINAFGVFADPKFKVPIDEQTVFEQ